MAASPVPDPSLPHGKQDPLIVLAMLCWGEARSESRQGRLAVCFVVRNRMLLAPRYGTGWRGVALRAWQFSCFNPNDPNRDKSLRPLKYDSEAAWNGCYRAAKDVYEERVHDNTGGATHYHTKNIPKKPKWSSVLLRTAEIGRHVFFGMEI